MQVAVVGSGPAGLMAAQVLAEAGCDVGVFEQHRALGRKFLLAGRSGLNLTHTEPAEGFVGRYEPPHPLLIEAVRDFDAAAVRSWCASLGEPTVVGSSGRVFPSSHRATALLRAWLRRLDGLGVRRHSGHRWIGWSDEGALAFETGDAVEAVTADATVLACGGPSWPRVGGDGSWHVALAREGVAVAPFRPANCAVEVEWSTVMLARHEGSPLKNVAVRVPGETPVRGDLVITRNGLEGGPVYAMSRHVRDEAPPTRRQLVLDLLPDLTDDALRGRLGKRRVGATQTSWLRGIGLGDVAISLLRDATGNALPDGVGDMAALLRAVTLPVTGTASLDRAISSAGGVQFDELDEHFMLRARPGTFAAGEMLDWEAPTGGYLLQACFSTGVAAALGVLAWRAGA